MGDALKGFSGQDCPGKADDDEVDSAYQVDQALERMQLLTARSQFDSFENNQEMRRSVSTSSRSRGNTLRRGEDTRQMLDLKSKEEYQLRKWPTHALAGDVDRAQVNALIYISAHPR